MNFIKIILLLCKIELSWTSTVKRSLSTGIVKNCSLLALSSLSQYSLYDRSTKATRSHDACRLNDVSCSCRLLVLLCFPKLLNALYTDV